MLDQLNPQLHLGDIMIGENQYIQTLENTGFKQHTDADFATAQFNGGSTDTDNHNRYAGLKVGTVATIYNSFKKQILTNYDPVNHIEPFRLIAVVNRLDLAGDFDMRTGSELAAANRRWFGEGRLVYAVNTTLNGQAYPMTVIMEFRLPALTTDKNGQISSSTIPSTLLLDRPTRMPGGKAANCGRRSGRTCRRRNSPRGRGSRS